MRDVVQLVVVTQRLPRHCRPPVQSAVPLHSTQRLSAVLHTIPCALHSRSDTQRDTVMSVIPPSVSGGRLGSDGLQPHAAAKTTNKHVRFKIVLPPDGREVAAASFVKREAAVFGLR